MPSSSSIVGHGLQPSPACRSAVGDARGPAPLAAAINEGASATASAAFIAPAGLVGIAFAVDFMLFR
eukprot:scaffold13123_cov112-Isochrysis_galbana.AAC.1